MGCSRRFWPNQSAFLPFLSFHWECRRLKNEICALQRKEKAESFVWKSNLEAKRQKWQDQRAASTDFSLKIQFLMQRRIWAGFEQARNGQQEDAHLQNITKTILLKIKSNIGRDQAWVKRKGWDRGFVFSAVGEELPSVRGGLRAADGRRWIFDAIFPGPPPDVP